MSTHLNTKNRFLLLDVMRAFAVFMMIQGHSIDALLSDSYYNSNSLLFNIWLFNRGLTAPIFLFGSGFAYVIATSRKKVDGALPRDVIVRRLRWIGVLFLIGALMHLPVSNFHGVFGGYEADWKQFYHVDVLRLMAVSLLGLFALLMITKSRKQLFVSGISIALFLAFSAPLVYMVDWLQHLHPSLAGFMTTKTGSWFPVFPFTAYLLFGAAGGALYLHLKEQGKEHRLLLYFGIAGVVLLAAAFVPRMVYGWKLPFYGGSSSPWLTFSRLAWVLMLWTIIGAVLRQVKTLPKIIPVAGQHTLFIYVSHIVVLYGSAWLPGLRQIFGKNMELLPVLAIISLLLISTTAAANELHKAKLQQTRAYRLAPYAAVLVIAMMMAIA